MFQASTFIPQQQTCACTSPFSCCLAYLDIKVNEQNHQCGHIGELEDEASKRKTTRFDNCTERMCNGEQKLNLLKEEKSITPVAE